ncbi:MAG: hypothetical protein EBX52_01015 [Proteobacteria bacterium]|nr:hypothetical protein [Pseudomonadota bacterium]
MNLKILEPNLGDYAVARKNFTWDREWKLLLGPGLSDFVNLGELATGRAIRMGFSPHRAVRFIRHDGEREDYTYGRLHDEAQRVASGLHSNGISRGDRLFTLLPRGPELHLGVLGALRNGTVVAPLYSSFGPEPIKTRMNLGAAKAILTTEALYRTRIAPIRAQVPSLEHIILTDADPSSARALNASSWEGILQHESPRFETVRTRPEDPALLHFTSGTTGLPKGVLHAHAATVMHFTTGRLALDFHPDDVFWCTADPGWVTGTSYGIFSPLLNGITSLVDAREFDPARWYQTLQDESVSVWYTSPTAILPASRS